MSCACAMEPRHQLKLINIIKHSEETYSYDFEKAGISEWDAGDNSKIFLMVGEKEVGKAFSYATLPEEGVVRFTTKIKSEPSPYKQALAQVNLGDWIGVTEPKGEFKLRREGRPIVLLSNGVGIAAIRSLVKAFEKDPSGVPMLLQVNVDAGGEIYGEEFGELAARRSDFKSRYTNSRSAFYPALRETIISLWESVDQTPLFYTVGSEAFVRDVVTYLYEAGYTDEDVVMDASGCGCSTGGGCGSKKVVQLESFMAL